MISPERRRQMKVQWGMVLVLSLLATACGDRAGSSAKNKQTEDRPLVQSAATAAETALEPDAESAAFQVREIRLTPEVPTVSTPVTAEAVYSGVPPEEIVFNYEWVVNNEKVSEVTGPVLEPSHFKKKAWVSCRVVPTWPGRKGDEVRSKFVRIANSTPVLTIPPLEPFQVPGELKCRFQAVDPDGDSVSFQLISPLDQGIGLDPQTGALSWKIDEETAKRLGESIEIKVAASDDEGAKVIGGITLNTTNPK